MNAFILIAGLCSLLIVYHHVGWPILLRYMGRKHVLNQPITPCSTHREPPDLADITIIIPAYNEEDFIVDKLWNLTCIDYPRKKVQYIIVCDGCMDNTVALAQETLEHPAFAEIDIILEENPINKGKLSIINKKVTESCRDIIGLSDCSALLSSDSLLLASEHFNTSKIGIVCASYHILNHGSEGEKSYWEYQRFIKQCEGAMGDVIGAHGAFYLFRRELFTPLDPDIINDDFVLPMQIVSQGYRAIYEPSVIAVELERAALNLDWNRRKRIAAGNMQQVLRLLHILHPRYSYTALCFWSGKVLRAFMPFILLLLFISTGWLAYEGYIFFVLFFVAQSLTYGMVIGLTFYPSNSKLLNMVSYLVTGHTAGLIGSCRYILGQEKGHWRRAQE